MIASLYKYINLAKDEIERFENRPRYQVLPTDSLGIGLVKKMYNLSTIQLIVTSCLSGLAALFTKQAIYKYYITTYPIPGLAGGAVYMLCFSLLIELNTRYNASRSPLTPSIKQL